MRVYVTCAAVRLLVCMHGLGCASIGSVIGGIVGVWTLSGRLRVWCRRVGSDLQHHGVFAGAGLVRTVCGECKVFDFRGQINCGCYLSLTVESVEPDMWGR